MKPKFSTIAGLLLLCLAGCPAGAATQDQARVLSSTLLPGGKYIVLYEFAGIEYRAVSATPVGASMPVVVDLAGRDRPGADGHGTAGPPRAVPGAQPHAAPYPGTRTEVFPVASSRVGGYFIDPIASVLNGVGLGLLLRGGWHGDMRHGDR